MPLPAVPAPLDRRLRRGDQGNSASRSAALWGGLFTALSFLTTTGFVSADWDAAQGWSGLPTPGLILMGLAMFGGGVATTAGGVKLLRVYALYKHGRREMRAAGPPAAPIGGGRSSRRRIRREGAFIAWIFFMLFALSIARSVALALLRASISSQRWC